MPVKLVIAAQPTRGLDVGSIEYIHRRIVEQRDAGAAILIVSTELDEVLAVGDRIAVMFEGRIVGILSGADATYEKLGMLMGGAEFGQRGGRGMTRVKGESCGWPLIPLLAVITALLFGAILIVLTDFENLSSWAPIRSGPSAARSAASSTATGRCSPARSVIPAGS